jgi:hypothetical protein
MLDIRATGYISPLAEVPFSDVPLTVHLVNAADETGLVTGTFRVYNDATGLLIHTSEIAPVTLTAGQSVDASALTDFDPPAAVDDTYFLLFDGNASNPLVPDGIAIHLGASYFDTKVGPMGPPPAAHAVTHEIGGADPIEPANLQTTELDDNLRLSPDGAGGVKWAIPLAIITDHDLLTHLDYADAGHTGFAPDPHDNAAHSVTFEDQANKGIAGGYCGLPNPLDTTLPLRADGTPARPAGLFIETDFIKSEFPFFSLSPYQSGTQSVVASTDNHPGITLFKAKTSAGGDSGYYHRVAPPFALVTGSEESESYIQPRVLAGSTIRLGLIDTITNADCTNGVYLEMTTVGGVPGTLVGKTAAAGARSTTASSYVLTSNTWYHTKIVINAAASLVTFTLYSEAGAVLWTDTLNANIPTAAGQETGIGTMANNTTG